MTNVQKSVYPIQEIGVQKPGGTRPCWLPCFGELDEGGYKELPETI